MDKVRANIEKVNRETAAPIPVTLPPPPPVPVMQGVRAAAAEAAEKLLAADGAKQFRFNLERHTDGDTVFCRSANRPPPALRRLISRWAIEEGVLLASAAQLDSIRKDDAEHEAILRDMSAHGHTTEHYRALVAADNARAGTPAFCALSHDPTQVHRIVAAGLRIKHEQRREVRARTAPVLLAIGENIRGVVERAFLTLLGDELHKAHDMGLGFEPSVELCCLDCILADVNQQIRAIERYPAHCSPSEVFFGLVREMLDASK